MTEGELKALAADLRALDARIPTLITKITKDTGPHPLNDKAHAFERTGWLMLRAAAALINDGDRARKRATDWSARGFPAGAPEPGGRGAGSTTSVEAAVSTSDQWERTVIQLDLERRLLDDNASSIEHRIHQILDIRPNEGRRSSVITCANPRCDHTISGLGDDIPRHGRCQRCAKHRSRYPGFDWPNKPGASHLTDADAADQTPA